MRYFPLRFQNLAMNPANWTKKRLRRLRLAWLGRYGTLTTPGQWVFIVGCYNSGTTLLHDVLAGHPDVAHLPREGQYCTDQLLVPSDAGLARAWATAPQKFALYEDSGPPPDPLRTQRQWSSLMSDPGRPVFLEKSIPNAARIRWLNAHFRNAYFVAIIRNGYAVAEGIRRKAGLPLQQSARQWEASNRIMLQDLKAVDHSMLISYEEFTASPGETLAAIYSFLGLSSAHNLADQRQWTIHGVTSDIRNMNHRSLQQLDAEQRNCIEAEAGDLLKEFEYSASIDHDLRRNTR